MVKKCKGVRFLVPRIHQRAFSVFWHSLSRPRLHSRTARLGAERHAHALRHARSATRAQPRAPSLAAGGARSAAHPTRARRHLREGGVRQKACCSPYETVERDCCLRLLSSDCRDHALLAHTTKSAKTVNPTVIFARAFWSYPRLP